MRVVLAAAFALVFLPSRALTQSGRIDALSLHSGARARILVPTSDSKYILVRVASARLDSLRYSLDRSADMKSLSWQQITKMDASIGRRRNIARGAGIGFLVGAIGGALLGAQDKSELRPVAIVGSGVFLGGVGAIAGGILGFSRGEKWIPVTLPRTL